MHIDLKAQHLVVIRQGHSKKVIKMGDRASKWFVIEQGYLIFILLNSYLVLRNDHGHEMSLVMCDAIP